MREISSHCNQLTDDIRARFGHIHEAQHLLQQGRAEEALTELNKGMLNLEVETESIDVHTSFYTLPPEEPQ
jgi:hypothetical protein